MGECRLWGEGEEVQGTGWPGGEVGLGLGRERIGRAYILRAIRIWIWYGWAALVGKSRRS